MNVVSRFTLIYISIDTVFRPIRTHQYGYIYTRSLGLMNVFARFERIDITYSCNTEKFKFNVCIYEISSNRYKRS